MKTRQCVIVDIDNVISDSRWREEHLPDFDKFHSLCGQDHPVAPVVALVNALGYGDFELIGVTGRNEKWRAETVSWMLRHGVWIDDILMRPDADFRPAPELKLALVRNKLGDDQAIAERVAFVLDDREDILGAFRELGVIGLRVTI